LLIIKQKIMSKDSSSEEIRNDEIDLLELFRRFWKSMIKLFTGIGNFILICIFFLIKNSGLLILSLFIGIALSFLVKWTLKPVYASEITFRTNAVSNAELIPYINKLSQLLKEKNLPVLASSLSLPEQSARKIKDIEAFWIIDKNNDSIPDFVDYKNKHNVYDTVNVRMKDRFVIRAMVYDPKELVLIRNGIVSYVESNPFFQEKNNLRLRQTNEMLIRLNYDIKQLDSLQKVKYFEETRNRQPGKDGQIIFLQEQKTQLVYADIYNLYRLKLEYDREKDLYPGILTLLSDFFQPLKRLNGGIYYGVIIIPVCFGLMLFYLIYRRNRKKLKEIYKKY
jgi:hypothetical protein